MNKTYKAKMVSALEQTPTGELADIFKMLVSWTENHEKRKSSYFWTPPTSASSRRWEEKKYSFDSEVKIGEDTICYSSDCSMSCHHVYWKDSIYVEGKSEIKINFKDIASLLECIAKVIADRENNA